MSTMLFYSFIFTVATLTDALEFIAKDWWIPNAPPEVPPINFVMVGKTLKISCLTNDPRAKVDLLLTSKKHIVRNAVTWLSPRVTQKNQTFILRDIRVSDSAEYICTAQSDDGGAIELVKGNLIVSNVRPQIIPKISPDNETIYIERNGSYEVTCESPGAHGQNALLTWYKQEGDYHVEVDKSQIVSSDEMMGGDYINVEKLLLLFHNFSANDVGEYICERQYRNERVTYKSVNVVFKDESNVNTTTTNQKEWAGRNIVDDLQETVDRLTEQLSELREVMEYPASDE